MERGRKVAKEVKMMWKMQKRGKNDVEDVEKKCREVEKMKQRCRKEIENMTNSQLL